MGVGIPMMHCMHHGETMTVDMIQSVTSDHEGCHETTSECMTVEVVKLSPASMAQSMHVDFQSIQPMMIAHVGLEIPFIQFVRFISPQIIRVMPHAPPTHYLHLIRVLII